MKIFFIKIECYEVGTLLYLIFCTFTSVSLSYGASSIITVIVQSNSLTLLMSIGGPISGGRYKFNVYSPSLNVISWFYTESKLKKVHP